MGIVYAQPENVLDKILEIDTISEQLNADNISSVQILLGVVEQNKVYQYKYGPDEYFYPASTIKLCMAAATLQFLNEISQEKNQTIDISAQLDFQNNISKGLASGNSVPPLMTIEDNLKDMLIVSGNYPYNRLYELIGQQKLNEILWAAGLPSSRLNHRLSVFLTPEENLSTGKVVLRTDPHNITILPQMSTINWLKKSPIPLPIGKTHYFKGKHVKHPMDFRLKNSISLAHLQDTLIMVTRPDLLKTQTGFSLTPKQLTFLQHTLQLLPYEEDAKKWPTNRYSPYRFKYFLKGIERVYERKDISLMSKAGGAYGFILDNAYIKHNKTNQAFYLTIVAYTNADSIINNNNYEYSVAKKLFADIAEQAVRVIFSE